METRAHVGEAWEAKADLVSGIEPCVYLAFNVFNEECGNSLYSIEVFCVSTFCIKQYY